MSYKPQRTFMGSEGEYSVDDRGPEALKQDLDNLMNMFDPTAVHPDGSSGGIDRENLAFDLNGPDMAGTIGGKLDGVAMTVQQIADTLLNMVKDRYTKLESDAKLKEKTDPLLKSLSYDSATGVLKVTTESGVESQVFDLNIEKIPASISILREGNAVFIRIVNDDGTYTQSDVTDLLAQYSFIESVTLKPTINKNGANTSVTYEIKDASIKLAHLSSEVTSTITNAVEAAQLSASNANSSAVNAADSKAAAELSESKAAASKTAASGYASKAEESSDRASNHENNAKSYAANASTAAASAEENAKLSKSYAVGGTGTREGENTDNAKHYYEQAKATVSAGGLTVFIQSTEPDINNCLWFKTADTNTQIGALLNVKDASGTVNEIYLITKAENVQGLAELVSNAVSGKADKTALDNYLHKTLVNAQTIESPLTIRGNVAVEANLTANSMSLYTKPTMNYDVVNKDYIDTTIAKLPMYALVIKASEVTDYQATAEAINAAVIAGREVLLERYTGSSYMYYYLDISNFTNKITKYTSYYFYSIADDQLSGYIAYAWMSLQNETIKYSSKYYMPQTSTITLTSANWDSVTKAQTVNTNRVTAKNTVTVSPATKESADIWAESGVFCTEQGDGTLKFTCTDVPTADISVNVVVVG